MAGSAWKVALTLAVVRPSLTRTRQRVRKTWCSVAGILPPDLVVKITEQFTNGFIYDERGLILNVIIGQEASTNYLTGRFSVPHVIHRTMVRIRSWH
jgi:hypothetical protein